jgi:peptidoglycan/xylan/chitin deacetylase (PgdA/CDA1 family)
MPIWKQLLLSVYYHTSSPLRWWNRCVAVSEDRVPIIVVYYHRIADDRANRWTTSNRMFARQIGWLRNHFELVSLEEAQRRVRCGLNHHPCVSITFDDGYADNCHRAIPLLIKEKIPCTYFVTVRNVVDGRPFRHDLANGHRFLPNSIEQLQAMAAAGIEIGAHTGDHVDLGATHDARVLYQEIVAAGIELRKALGRPVRYFAFPYGQYWNLSPEAFELARRANYDAVCSAYGGFNYPGDDAFHLQRIAVDNDMIGLKNWVTGDPRKLHVPRYGYEATSDGQKAESHAECASANRERKTNSRATRSFTPIADG